MHLRPLYNTNSGWGASEWHNLPARERIPDEFVCGNSHARGSQIEGALPSAGGSQGLLGLLPGGGGGAGGRTVKLL